MSYQSKVYRRQGGDELVVASGGKINIETGGTIEVNGDDLIAEVAALSGLDSGELQVLNAVTPGTLAASKAVVVNAASHIDALKVTTLSLGASGAAVAVTATAAELNYCDVTTAGTAQASKAVVLDANAHVNAVKTTALSLGATGAATLVTTTAAQLNTLGTTVGGVTALVAAGLGGSHSILKTEADTHQIVAAHATKARAVLVIVTVDEPYAIGTGTLPTVAVGETDSIDKFMLATVLDTEAAGVVLVFAGTNTATKAIIATSTAAVGNATGGCTVTVLAIPTT